MVHSKTCEKWKSCLEHRSLITWNIGKSLKMMTKSLDSWRKVEKSLILKSLHVVNLQNNTFPKVCVPLEHLFDRNNVFKGKKPNKQTDEALEFNIDTKMDPRMVKIGKGTTEKERIEIVDLIREFKDTFAWNYDEQKAYRGDVIPHAIPLTEGAKPFRNKLRHINPKLENQIQKEL
jgi:hypothetical protein